MLDISLPPHLTTWFLSFLNNRLQFVSIDNVSSNFNVTNAGTPQGTISGPLCFNLLINDLMFLLPYLKYVDDTSVLSISDDPLDTSLQHETDNLCRWCDKNGMRVNPDKTKEMLLYFGKKYPTDSIPNIIINGTPIERTSCFKLLGVYFNNQLTWSDHISYIVAKASKRIYCITQLTRCSVNPKNIITVYCSIIRSVLEYCCQVWHPGITKQQSNEIEFVQKRCLKIIFPTLSYNSALQISGLQKLSDRRERLVVELFHQIKSCDFMSDFFINRSKVQNTRNHYSFNVPLTRTNRADRDFITYCLQKHY